MAIVTWWNEALEALSGEAYFLEARRRTAGQGRVACENLFNTYVRAVCGQQVNTAVAEKMAQSVFGYAGDKGDNAADALAGSSVDALRNLGLSQTKAGALVGSRKSMSRAASRRRRWKHLTTRRCALD